MHTNTPFRPRPSSPMVLGNESNDIREYKLWFQRILTSHQGETLDSSKIFDVDDDDDDDDKTRTGPYAVRSDIQ